MNSTLEVLLMIGLVYVCGMATGAVGMGLYLLRVLYKSTDKYIKKVQGEMEDQLGGEDWKQSKEKSPRGGLTDDDYRKLLGGD